MSLHIETMSALNPITSFDRHFGLADGHEKAVQVGVDLIGHLSDSDITCDIQDFDYVFEYTSEGTPASSLVG
jgi:hypothetical protein